MPCPEEGCEDVKVVSQNVSDQWFPFDLADKVLLAASIGSNELETLSRDISLIGGEVWLIRA